MRILGYFVHKDDTEITPVTAMVIFETDGELLSYSPIGQHILTDYDYLAECVPITKKQYLQASKGFYTPTEYL